MKTIMPLSAFMALLLVSTTLSAAEDDNSPEQLSDLRQELRT